MLIVFVFVVIYVTKVCISDAVNYQSFFFVKPI